MWRTQTTFPASVSLQTNDIGRYLLVPAALYEHLVSKVCLVPAIVVPAECVVTPPVSTRVTGCCLASLIGIGIIFDSITAVHSVYGLVSITSRHTSPGVL